MFSRCGASGFVFLDTNDDGRDRQRRLPLQHTLAHKTVDLPRGGLTNRKPKNEKSVTTAAAPLRDNITAFFLNNSND